MAGVNTNVMKQLTRIAVFSLAGFMILAAGCHRSDPQTASQTAEGGAPLKQRRHVERMSESEVQERIPPSPENPMRPFLVQRPPKILLKNDDKLLNPLPDRVNEAIEDPANPQDSLSPSIQAPTKGERNKAQGAELATGSKKEQADAVFDRPTLLRIQIEIPPEGLNVLRRTRWDNGQERPVAKATVREGDRIYTNVAVHLKGSAGSFRPIENKPALTLNFDKFVPEQNFHGLHKISLNNSVQDSSYLCEKIARELFIAAGVPAPRASHATVQLNGRNLGFYVVLEGANKQFLKRFFDHPKGNLYDGGFCRDIGSRLTAHCGDNPTNHSGLKALRSAVRDPSFARLEKVLDMDRFLAMVSLEMMLCHWDGYTLNKNNWRIFHDTEASRMVFIPHGLDQLFGAGRQFDPNASIIPQQIQGEVARAVLSTTEGQRRYLERFGRVYTNVFKVHEITARIDEIVAGISPALAETDPQVARAFQRRSSVLKQRMVRRNDGLRQQLGLPLETQHLDSGEVMQLTGWDPVVLTGDPALSEAQGAMGEKILVINSGATASSSSWRSHAVLGPGKYQFEGRVRIKGVTVTEGDDRGGAGLRVSKGSMPRKLVGTSEWKDFKYAFSVGAQGSDVELICELKAAGGEAWFEEKSLRLVMLH